MTPARLETFADGVFAIAATLLILNVDSQVGDESGTLGARLLHIWPSYVAYGVSFVTIGIMWVNHHLVFRQFARVDRPLLLLNVLLLMLIAFVPFPTRVVAQNAHTAGDREAAALLYGITMTATAILPRRCATCWSTPRSRCWHSGWEWRGSSASATWSAFASAATPPLTRSGWRSSWRRKRARSSPPPGC